MGWLKLVSLVTEMKRWRGGCFCLLYFLKQGKSPSLSMSSLSSSLLSSLPSSSSSLSSSAMTTHVEQKMMGKQKAKKYSMENGNRIEELLESFLGCCKSKIYIVAMKKGCVVAFLIQLSRVEILSIPIVLALSFPHNSRSPWNLFLLFNFNYLHLTEILICWKFVDDKPSNFCASFL